MNGDALIRDYLGRLEAASGPLSPVRRDELRTEVAEHIEAALAEGGVADEATVRNVLDRLGPPEDIVAAESTSGAQGLPGGPVIAAPAAARPGWGPVEILAVLLLTLGYVVLPFIGPLTGLVLVWASSRWDRREKWIATVIVVVLLVVPIVLVLGAGTGFEVSSIGAPTEALP
jgi:hypothetical protein